MARCEIRWNDDGTIDELLVFDDGGKCLFHMEDMGSSFWVGIGDAHFSLAPGYRMVCAWPLPGKSRKQFVRAKLTVGMPGISGHVPDGVIR
jgi:hypothetical protein